LCVDIEFDQLTAWHAGSGARAGDCFFVNCNCHTTNYDMYWWW